MAGPGRIRMRDVAAAVGVSVKTVSEALNGTGQVRDRTRERVLAAAAELGYRPDPVARGLNAARTGMICLALPRLGYGYCAPLAAAVFDAARGMGLSVVLEPTDGDPVRERAAVDGDTRIADGVLLVPHAVTGRELAATVPVTPAVAMGPRRVDGPFDRIHSADEQAGETATRALLDRGCTRIVLLGGSSGESAGARGAGTDAGAAGLRSRGYRRALVSGGLPVVPELVVGDGARQAGDGRAAVAALLAAGVRFDGLLALEEPLAHGALHALRTAGTAVPDAVRVVAFGTGSLAGYATPSITTVEPDVSAMAGRALALLAGRIGGYAGPWRTERTGYTVVHRESTGA
ncbi:hypothetical protein AFB00_28635 [Pseudonocardia sp. HH130630-07]|nr:hypothetical protein AFB00_28635 [Pseudonocardia sp. HH130630-07]